MTLVSWAKKELIRVRIAKPKRLLLNHTSLGSIESLATPPVQEVVLAADLKCHNCQKRVADAISKMEDVESIVVHVVEKKVTITRKSDGRGSSRKVPAVYNNLSGKVSRIVQFSFP